MACIFGHIGESEATDMCSRREGRELGREVAVNLDRTLSEQLDSDIVDIGKLCLLRILGVPFDFLLRLLEGRDLVS